MPSPLCKHAFGKPHQALRNISCPAERFEEGNTCWRALAAGESEMLVCGKFYDVVVTRRCEENGVSFPNEGDINSQCYQPAALGYIHPILYYGFLPVSIVVVFIAIFILVKMTKQRKAERTLRLNLLVLIGTFLSLVVMFISNLLMVQLQSHVPLDTLFRLCLASNIFVTYFIEVRNFWLFNIGIFLLISLLRPLHRYRWLVVVIHMIGWVLPWLPILFYFITLGIHVDWEIAHLCRPPPSTFNYLYIIEAPSMLTYLFDVVAVIIILRILRRKLRFQVSRASSRSRINKTTSRTFRTFIWLFGLMGQWKIFLLVPVWDLPPRARFFYSLWILFVHFLSGIIITIPTCFYNHEVRQHIRKYFRLRRELSAMASGHRLSSHRRSDNSRRRRGTPEDNVSHAAIS